MFDENLYNPCTISLDNKSDPVKRQLLTIPRVASQNLFEYIWCILHIKEADHHEHYGGEAHPLPLHHAIPAAWFTSMGDLIQNTKQED